MSAGYRLLAGYHSYLLRVRKRHPWRRTEGRQLTSRGLHQAKAGLRLGRGGVPSSFLCERGPSQPGRPAGFRYKRSGSRPRTSSQCSRAGRHARPWCCPCPRTMPRPGWPVSGGLRSWPRNGRTNDTCRKSRWTTNFLCRSQRWPPGRLGRLDIQRHCHRNKPSSSSVQSHHLQPRSLHSCCSVPG